MTSLSLLHSGKVRELYDLGGDLLMVASDRISTYDAVHPTPIPDKGKVLTGLSVLWFGLTRDIVPNHFVSATDGVPEEFRGRGLRVRRLKMLPVECIVRGYITGSGWKDYQRTGSVSGIALPDGLQESEQLPEPIYTPSTKAEEGHDEAIDFERRSGWSAGRNWLPAAGRVDRGLQGRRGARARARRDPGRHEVRVRARCGWRTDAGRRGLHAGLVALLAADSYEVGRGQPSFDKQYVRDWATSTGWDKLPPARRSRTRSSRRRASAT